MKRDVKTEQQKMESLPDWVLNKKIKLTKNVKTTTILLGWQSSGIGTTKSILLHLGEYSFC